MNLGSRSFRRPRTGFRKTATKSGFDTARSFFLAMMDPTHVTEAFPHTSTYRLHILNAPSTFHASQLKRYVRNNPGLFPRRELARDGPVTLENGEEEYVVERILDERKRGRGWQYLVRCKGYGPGDGEWMARRDIGDNRTGGVVESEGAGWMRSSGDVGRVGASEEGRNWVRGGGVGRVKRKEECNAR